jgi:hypothetical protein
MRQVLVCALLLLGLCSAAPEPEYAMPSGQRLHALSSVGALVEIESSVGGADRVSSAASQSDILRVEVLKPEDDHAVNVAPASADVDIPFGNTRSVDVQLLATHDLATHEQKAQLIG